MALVERMAGVEFALVPVVAGGIVPNEDVGRLFKMGLVRIYICPKT